jgi:hypothetical protein
MNGGGLVSRPLPGNLNRGELARAEQAHQLGGVAPIRLDPRARASRGQRRGNHVAWHAACGDLAVEVIARHGRLIARRDRSLAGEALDEVPKQMGFLRQLALLGLRRPGSQDRDNDLRLLSSSATYVVPWSMVGLPFACGSGPPGTTHDHAIGQAGPSILSRRAGTRNAPA